MNKKFSISLAFKNGFKILRANLKFFALFSLANFAFVILMMLFLDSFALLLLNPSMSFSELRLQTAQADNCFSEKMLLAKNFKAIFFAHQWIIGSIISVLLFLLVCIVIGYRKVAFSLHDKKKVSIKFLYQFYALVPRVFAAWLMMLGCLCLGIIAGFYGFAILGVFLGSMLGLLCGLLFGLLSMLNLIFLYQRMSFATFFIIDKNFSVLQAFKASWKLTQGSAIHLSGLSVLLGFLGYMIDLIPIYFVQLFCVYLYCVFFELTNVSVFRQMLKK